MQDTISLNDFSAQSFAERLWCFANFFQQEVRSIATINVASCDFGRH